MQEASGSTTRLNPGKKHKKNTIHARSIRPNRGKKTEDSTAMVASAEKRQHEEHGRNLPVVDLPVVVLPVDVRRRGGQGWSPATSLRVKVKGEVVVVPPV
jgi:hypothetical protein